MTDYIYPINVTVYRSHKEFTTGLVYSSEELAEIVAYVLDKNLHYAVAFREEDDGTNNPETTRRDETIPASADAESNL